jgi:Fe-S cluster assembly protein SufB
MGNSNSQSQISKDLVKKISKEKKEPGWMTDYRLDALEVFKKRKLPKWGPSQKLKELDLDDLEYYIKPTDAVLEDWEAVPSDIRAKYDALGIPEDEKRFLAGVGAQYESDMVYHSLKEKFAEQGVYFADMGTALQKRPKLVKKYFGKLIPPQNNKFAALNGALWSGGSFIYIPRGVYLEQPLHNFFQMSKPSQGQFERTIIIAEEGSYIEFIEGCIAPMYSAVSVHAGVVEVFVGKDAEVKFTTLQNWSKNVWNLVTKKARVEQGGSVDWMDGNVGSGLTMKYPAVDLVGRGASARISSLVFSGSGQIMDAGAKVAHLASNTKSIIESKSILRGGESVFRGRSYIGADAKHSKSSIDCTSLMLDKGSRSATKPDLKCFNKTSNIDHESSVLRFTREQLNYLRSRSLNQKEARSVLIGGFVEPFISKLPLEYAVEFNRLIDLEMEENSVG